MRFIDKLGSRSKVTFQCPGQSQYKSLSQSLTWTQELVTIIAMPPPDSRLSPAYSRLSPTKLFWVWSENILTILDIFQGPRDSLQGLLYLQNLDQEHPVLQGSNLEMVDRSVLDRVPDVLETWFSKHGTSRAFPTYRMWFKDIMSSKDPTWRWSMVGGWDTSMAYSTYRMYVKVKDIRSSRDPTWCLW